MDPGPEDRIALIEQLERDGRVLRCVDVRGWPLSIGRALENHLVIDDPHLAPRHAVLALAEDGSLQLRALPSQNGLRLNGRVVTGSAQVPAGGALLQLGTTRLRLRLAGETLAPERPLPGGGTGVVAPALMALAVMALVLTAHALALDPGAPATAWLPVAIGLPLAVVGWCAVWALMSKLFQHRFDFTGHLRTLLPWLLGLTLVDLLWPQVAASLGTPRLWQLAAPTQALITALLVRAHLVHVLPQRPRVVSAVVAALFVGGMALSATLMLRQTDSLTPTPYMSTLPLPGLRLSGTVPIATLVQDLGPLAETLAQRAKKSRDDDGGNGGPGGDPEDGGE
jgi:hypothetical protein